jgi:superfamily II DNA or RNA helicase
MSLTQELSSDFPSAIRSRGADYFQGRRVKITRGNDWEVDATVRGTTTYKVNLARDDDEIIVSCSCPYYETDGACKHIWATMLAADEKDYLRGDGGKEPLTLAEAYVDDDFDGYDLYDDEDEDDDEDDPFISSVINILNTEPQKRSQLPSWKDQLAVLGRTSQEVITGQHGEWPPNRRIIYVADIPATLDTQHLIIDTLLQDRKLDGEWGKPRKQRIPRWQIVELPEPDDRQIFAMLAGAREQFEHGYYSYNYQDAYDTVPYRYRLNAPLPHIILPLIARTGRCYLKIYQDSDDLTPIVWDEGEPWQFALRVRRDEKNPDQYEVKGTLSRGEEELDFTRPVLLLSGGLIFTREFAAAFDDGGAFHWISMLRRTGTLTVPTNQISEFMREMLNNPQPPRLDIPEELHYEVVTARPRPCLIVKAQQHSTRLRARVSFDYGEGASGCLIEGDNPRRGVYDAESRRYILRDKGAETVAVNRLAEMGLKYLPPNYYEKQRGWEIATSKLPRIVRELITEGWHVEAEGKTFRNPGQINIQVSSGIDWFELHGTVDFGGTTAKLPELLAALKRGDTMVKLGDGTYGMLPEEWLKKYGLIAGLGETHEDHLRFKKTQVGVLDALLAAQPAADFDEAFALARNELKKFDGVKSSDAPEGFIGELRPYQKDGLGWIQFLRQFGFGGCLADDMGLGKTVQVLALLELRRQLRENPMNGPRSKNNGHQARRTKDATAVKIAPSLAIVPKSLVFNWKQEAARFTPKLRILDHTGNTRQKAGEHFEDYDLIITTYGTLRRDAIDFKEVEFDYIILDEAQAIKNADTASAKAARLLHGDHRLALSGTPVENHLGELWSLFEFLNPGMLGAASVFKLTGQGARNPEEETRKLLAQALRPFILRRTKEQVAKDLPDKLEQTIFCELEPKQRKLYDELRDHYRNTLLKRIETEGLAKSKMHVLEALLRLRQAACHPGLIDKKRVKEPSAKLDLLTPQLVELFEEGHKVLVFSQFTSLLAILKSHLDQEKITYEYLDGQTRDRQARVERFQEDPECKLFLISLKAGGLGLNLTAAEYVYLLDPWWNPAVEAQAIDRAHRIGQTRQVFAYRIIARNTVEEKVLALQNTKRNLADAIINADNSLIRNLGREDLELLLS